MTMSTKTTTIALQWKSVLFKVEEYGMDFEGSVGLAGERVVSRQSKHISSATTAGQSGGGRG